MNANLTQSKCKQGKVTFSILTRGDKYAIKGEFKAWQGAYIAKSNRQVKTAFGLQWQAWGMF